MKLRRRYCAGLATALLTVPLVVSVSPTASAHVERQVGEQLLSALVRCPGNQAPLCMARGRVRLTNNRALGTSPVLVCLGVAVHTANHRDLSTVTPSRLGQASVRLRPQTSRVTTYEVEFDGSAGQHHHVHTTHAHIVRPGGPLC